MKILRGADSSFAYASGEFRELNANGYVRHSI